ncbi:hypothetical protein PSP6_160155 [Paraburkholderia tropica]|nr:hypothetical protein PSP6_160155 [Paraburkholderia tropica]
MQGLENARLATGAQQRTSAPHRHHIGLQHTLAPDLRTMAMIAASAIDTACARARKTHRTSLA